MKKYVPILATELSGYFGGILALDVALALADRGVDTEYYNVEEIRPDLKHGRYIVVLEELA